MIYKCIECNYSANRKSSYIFHLKTQKHLEKMLENTNVHFSTNSCASQCNSKNIKNMKCDTISFSTIKSEKLNKRDNISNKKIIECEYCKKTFTRQYSLMRHYSTCQIKKEKDMEKKIKEKYEIEYKIKELEFKLKQKEKDVDTMSKQIEEMKENEQFHKSMIASESNNLNGALQVSMSAITFLEKYHTETPPLKTFEEEFANPYQVYEQEGVKYENDGYIVNGVKIDKDKYIVDKMELLEQNEDTVKFFAWLMESIYRNHKYPHLQAYWAKDTARNNYSVRETVAGNIVIWSDDKDGKIIINKVITPLLKFTEAVLRKELNKLAKNVNIKKQERDINGMLILIKKQEILTGFINKVEKNELQEEIIKKMAPSFYLDVKKQFITIKSNKK